MSKSVGRRYWTDYPVVADGDMPNYRAPLRRVRLVENGEKWVVCETDKGVRFETKRGYLHRRKRGMGR